VAPGLGDVGGLVGVLVGLPVSVGVPVSVGLAVSVVCGCTKI
jgi:hypothetical protein